jgi:hypothetical protein
MTGRFRRTARRARNDFVAIPSLGHIIRATEMLTLIA